MNAFLLSPPQVLFLRNHGLLVGGATVEEAYHLLFNAMSAADTQVRLGANLDVDSLNLAGEDEIRRVVEHSSKPVTENVTLGRPASGRAAL